MRYNLWHFQVPIIKPMRLSPPKVYVKAAMLVGLEPMCGLLAA